MGALGSAHHRRGASIDRESLIKYIHATIAATGVSVALPRLVCSYGASFRTISLLTNVPSVLLALVARALGIVGMPLKDRRRAAAIIGTTLGAAHLVAASRGLLLAVLIGALLHWPRSCTHPRTRRAPAPPREDSHRESLVSLF